MNREVKKAITIRFSENEYKYLCKKAEQYGLSISSLVRMIVRLNTNDIDEMFKKGEI